MNNRSLLWNFRVWIQPQGKGRNDRFLIWTDYPFWKYILFPELKGFETSLVKDYSLSYIPFHFLLDGDRIIVKIYTAGGRVSDRDIEGVLNEGK
jgi:hypothetical protein